MAGYQVGISWRGGLARIIHGSDRIPRGQRKQVSSTGRAKTDRIVDQGRCLEIEHQKPRAAPAEKAGKSLMLKFVFYGVFGAFFDRRHCASAHRVRHRTAYGLCNAAHKLSTTSTCSIYSSTRSHALRASLRTLCVPILGVPSAGATHACGQAAVVGPPPLRGEDCRAIGHLRNRPLPDFTQFRPCRLAGRLRRPARRHGRRGMGAACCHTNPQRKQGKLNSGPYLRTRSASKVSSMLDLACAAGWCWTMNNPGQCRTTKAPGP